LRDGRRLRAAGFAFGGAFERVVALPPALEAVTYLRSATSGGRPLSVMLMPVPPGHCLRLLLRESNLP
jgi:hypothetical protein